MKRFALLSVSDKSGLDKLASFLVEEGFTLLSTGGTADFLKSKGFPVTSVSDFTESPEILDGRVKTLHPKIHGGVLARRSLIKDARELASIGGDLIDVVVVNLYPFTQQVQKVEGSAQSGHESLVEYIDIGGPTLLRAAAKNHADVVVLSDPEDYDDVASEWKSEGMISLQTRRKLAAKVFKTMAAYDGAIARYLSLEEQLLEEDGTPKLFAPYETLALERVMPLRYGENPHQKAALYRRVQPEFKPYWKQLQGKELSYNNLLDLGAACSLLADLSAKFPDRETAVIIKHLNPCGAAVSTTALDAFEKARACDPVSAFGGIIALSGNLDGELAQSITSNFVELIIAPSISPEGAAVIERKKNIRLISLDLERLKKAQSTPQLAIRDLLGDTLLQTTDAQTAAVRNGERVSGPEPDARTLDDMEFAWALCKHVKSNAIVLAKNLQAIGVGAGQMSRVDSARLSIERAKANGFDPAGAVSASDAFLPFPDTLEILNDSGIRALLQPGGSVKDEEVKNAAEKRSVTMYFLNERHFRH